MALRERHRMSALLLKRAARQNASETVYGGELTQFQLIIAIPARSVRIWVSASVNFLGSKPTAQTVPIL